jgi:hypothetical protein
MQINYECQIQCKRLSCEKKARKKEEEKDEFLSSLKK